jgi:hypothetical protein
MKTKWLLMAAVLVASSMFVSTVHATVLRVVVITTDDTAAYLKQIEQGQAVLKKLGSAAVLRVWRARFAGDRAGSIIVSIEYPDLVTYANDDKKVSASTEYQTWLKDLGKIRKVVSDSLYEELTR